jgi:hypothetical protein
MVVDLSPDPGLPMAGPGAPVQDIDVTARSATTLNLLNR